MNCTVARRRGRKEGRNEQSLSQSVTFSYRRDLINESAGATVVCWEVIREKEK